MKLEVSQGKNSPADGSLEKPLQAGVNSAGVRKNGFAVTWFTDSDGTRYWIPNAWDTTVLLSAKVISIDGSFENRTNEQAISYIESTKGENEDFDLMVPDVAENTRIEFRWTVRFRNEQNEEKTRIHTQSYYFSKEGTPVKADDKLTQIEVHNQAIAEIIAS